MNLYVWYQRLAAYMGAKLSFCFPLGFLFAKAPPLHSAKGNAFGIQLGTDTVISPLNGKTESQGPAERWSVEELETEIFQCFLDFRDVLVIPRFQYNTQITAIDIRTLVRTLVMYRRYIAAKVGYDTRNVL